MELEDIFQDGKALRVVLYIAGEWRPCFWFVFCGWFELVWFGLGLVRFRFFLFRFVWLVRFGLVWFEFGLALFGLVWLGFVGLVWFGLVLLICA